MTFIAPLLIRPFGRNRAVLALVACCGVLFIMVPWVSAGQDISTLFGSRVTANARFKAPFFTGDFDGDGTADAAYLVTVLPESAQDKLAGDVTVIGTQFGREPLGPRGETVALAIVQKSGRQKFLLTGYRRRGCLGFLRLADLGKTSAADRYRQARLENLPDLPSGRARHQA